MDADETRIESDAVIPDGARNVTRTSGHRLSWILGLILAPLPLFAGAAEWVGKEPAGPYFLELRVTPRPKVTETPFVIAVTHADGKPVATAKATGRASFSSAGLKGVATLHPDGENRMKGHGLMSASTDMRIEVSVSLPGEPPIKAVFAPRPRRD